MSRAVGHTILVVEDDSGVRWSLVEALLEEDYTVWEAQDGRKGLEMLARMPRPPSLVLLDMHMPEMDGRTFLREMRAMAEAAGVPVVVVSGDARDPELEVAGWMTKPVDRDALIDVVEETCARRHEAPTSTLAGRMDCEFTEDAREQFDRLPSDRKYSVQLALVRIAGEGRPAGGQVSLTINGLDIRGRVSSDGRWLQVESIEAPIEVGAAGARLRAARRHAS